MSTKASPNTGDLAPLTFTFSPLIPVGEAIELPGPLGWAMWDSAVRAQEQEHAS